MSASTGLVRTEPEPRPVRLHALIDCEPDTTTRPVSVSTGTSLVPVVRLTPAGLPTGEASREEPAERGPSRSELHALLRAILEALDGRRPVEQLRHRFSDHCYRTLLRQRRDENGHGRVRCLTRVHTCRPAQGVIELCATIRRSGRMEAAAARIEFDHLGWRCTAMLLL